MSKLPNQNQHLKHQQHGDVDVAFDTLVRGPPFLLYLVFAGWAFATTSSLNIVFCCCCLPALVARLCRVFITRRDAGMYDTT